MKDSVWRDVLEPMGGVRRGACEFMQSGGRWVTASRKLGWRSRCRSVGRKGE